MAGPVVTFPDPAILGEIAAVEAPRPLATVEHSAVRSIVFAAAFALLGGAIFAAVSYVTEMQFGIVSIVIGILAGVGAAKGGRSRRAQIIGATAAGFGYFVGQLFAVIVIVGKPFFHLPIDVIGDLVSMMIKGTFSSMDALFLAIAVHQGWSIPRVRQ